MLYCGEKEEREWKKQHACAESMIKMETEPQNYPSKRKRKTVPLAMIVRPWPSRQKEWL